MISENRFRVPAGITQLELQTTMATPTPDTADNYDQVCVKSSHDLCISMKRLLYFYWLQFDEDESEQQLGATASGRKRLFSKELRCMMYGFGDDQNPYTESVDFLEDLVIEFITETTHRLVNNLTSCLKF